MEQQPQEPPEQYAALFAKWVVATEGQTAAHGEALRDYLLALFARFDDQEYHPAELINTAFREGLETAATDLQQPVPDEAQITWDIDSWRHCKRLLLAHAEVPAGYTAATWDMERYLGWVAERAAERFSEFSLSEPLLDQTDES